MQFRTHLVPPRLAAKVTSAGVNTRTTITVHETANVARGANAAAHANLQYKGNSRRASWHLQVDDSEAVRSFPDSARCWHAGNPIGNRTSIGVEVCVNSDGNWRKAVENAARLVAHLMRENGVPLSAVRQHHSWTRKNCPTRLRGGIGGITWSDFIALVAQYRDGAAPAPAPTPAPAPAVKNAAAKRHYAPGEVKVIQERLYAAGFYTGRIDDDYGPLTAAAVRAYQAAQVYPRLVQDSDWGPVVEAHYAWTVRLQETLNLWKSTSPKLREDGSLPSVTIAAVARWQTRNRAIYRKHGGRIADGIPGPITAAALGIPAHP